MQKKNTIILGAVIVLILAVGAYALMHKSSPSYNANTNSSTTTAGTTNSKDQATAINNDIVVTKTDSSVGEYLATPSGQALYTYNGDSSGVSNCSGSCLANWPAYQDSGATTGLPTDFGTIKRADNSQTQYTYKNLPLYTFVGDSNGQMTGNGVSNFKVAQP